MRSLLLELKLPGTVIIVLFLVWSMAHFAGDEGQGASRSTGPVSATSLGRSFSVEDALTAPASSVCPSGVLAIQIEQ